MLDLHLSMFVLSMLRHYHSHKSSDEPTANNHLLSLPCFTIGPIFMAGSDIPASRYTLLTLAGFIQPVVARHTLFSFVSILYACVYRSHTGHAYSSIEWKRFRAVVLIVLGLAPLLDFLQNTVSNCNLCLCFQDIIVAPHVFSLSSRYLHNYIDFYPDLVLTHLY